MTFDHPSSNVQKMSQRKPDQCFDEAFHVSYSKPLFHNLATIDSLTVVLLCATASSSARALLRLHRSLIAGLTAPPPPDLL
jgi:hypothetical protein